mmetsp:Transcript_138653/g.241276  ORF Transcript_138653/g.241276 Transcript_138653/m.241276 type:complete len:347 (-) Transcript_138653:95-1135(-)
MKWSPDVSSQDHHLPSELGNLYCVHLLPRLETLGCTITLDALLLLALACAPSSGTSGTEARWAGSSCAASSSSSSPMKKCCAAAGERLEAASVAAVSCDPEGAASSVEAAVLSVDGEVSTHASGGRPCLERAAGGVSGIGCASTVAGATASATSLTASSGEGRGGGGCLPLLGLAWHVMTSSAAGSLGGFGGGALCPVAPTCGGPAADSLSCASLGEAEHSVVLLEALGIAFGGGPIVGGGAFGAIALCPAPPGGGPRDGGGAFGAIGFGTVTPAWLPGEGEHPVAFFIRDFGIAFGGGPSVGGGAFMPGGAPHSSTGRRTPALSVAQTSSSPVHNGPFLAWPCLV